MHLADVLDRCLLRDTIGVEQAVYNCKLDRWISQLQEDNRVLHRTLTAFFPKKLLSL